MRLGRERRSARKRRADRQRRRRTVIIVAVLVAVPLIGAAVFATFVGLSLNAMASVQDDLPSLEAQGEVSLAQTTQIYAADGTLLAYLHGVENRTVISGKEIPDVLNMLWSPSKTSASTATTAWTSKASCGPLSKRQAQRSHRGLLHHHHAAGRESLPRSHRHLLLPQVQRDGAGLADSNVSTPRTRSSICT
jgi:hypothetical protein